MCILQHRLKLLINQGGGTYQYNQLHYKNTFNEILISNICKFSIQSTFWGRNMMLLLEAAYSAFTFNMFVSCTHSGKVNLEKMLLKSKKTV